MAGINSTQVGHSSPKRFPSAAEQIGRRLRQRRGRLRRDKAAGKMPAAGRKGLESRRKTVKHTARRSNDRFGINRVLAADRIAWRGLEGLIRLSRKAVGIK